MAELTEWDIEHRLMCGFVGHTERVFKKFPFDTKLFKQGSTHRKIAEVYAEAENKEDVIDILSELSANLASPYDICVQHGHLVTYFEFSEAFHKRRIEFGLDIETDEGIFDVVDFMDDIEDLYENGVKRGESTGWENVDRFFTVVKGELTIVHGWPGSGKSEWLDALMVNLAVHKGWKFAVYSPENYPFKMHFMKLAEKFTSRPFDGPKKMSESDLMRATQFCKEHFRFILPTEYNTTLPIIMDRFDRVYKTFGCDGTVIDPWNEIEPTRAGNQTETEFVSSSLMKLRRFGREREIKMFVVQHPQKVPIAQGEEPRCPHANHLAGSAHWRNKADNIVAVHRSLFKSPEKVGIHVQKIKHKPTGQIGTTDLWYHNETGTYTGYGSPI